jgi:hypothetical protein
MPVAIASLNNLASTIKVAGMITYRLHSLRLACLKDVLRDHLTLDLDTLDFIIVILECAMLLEELGITLYTVGVAITFPVIPGPPVTVCSVEQGTVVVGTATIEESILHLVHWHTV